MNFKEVLSESLYNLKHSNKKLIGLCLATALLSACGSIYDDISKNKYNADDISTFLSLESKHQTDNLSMSVDDYLYDDLYNELDESFVNDNELDELLEEIYSLELDEYLDELESEIELDEALDFESNEEYNMEDMDFTLLPKEFVSDYKDMIMDNLHIIIAVVILIILVAMTISSLYQYFIYNFASETINKDVSSNYKNIFSSIGALILSYVSVLTLIILTVITAGLSISGYPMVCFLLIIFVASILYVTYKLLAVPYVCSNHKDLKAIDIIKKSFEITKGNFLKMLNLSAKMYLYIFVILIVLKIALGIISLIPIPAYIYLIIKFIYYVSINYLSTILLLLFNVIMFKNFDKSTIA